MKTFLYIVLFLYIAAFVAAVDRPTCGGKGSSKTVELITPSTPPRECVYTIKAYSKYVCQLRIEFSMTLAQPTIPSSNNNISYTECLNDYFKVGDLKLCGVETSQHIYVPFNRTAGVTSLELSISLATRTGTNKALPTPAWNMIVSQLECPAGSAVRSLELDRSLIAPMSSISTADGFYVAPPGCLQYFPHTSGSISTFNYNGGNGVYPGHMNYAICFRRTTETTGLQLKFNNFQLGTESELADAVDVDSSCYGQLNKKGVNDDYVMLPQATTQRSNIRFSYFCGKFGQDAIIRTSNPGPLQMLFNSDDIYKEDKEVGFTLKYKLI